MHPSEWSSILFNLYTNAKKAIKRSKNKGEIDIECGKIENRVFLRFSDTGDGINDDIKDRIFEEFFTTSSPNTLDSLNSSNEVTGTGLGLKIVKRHSPQVTEEKYLLMNLKKDFNYNLY